MKIAKPAHAGRPGAGVPQNTGGRMSEQVVSRGGQGDDQAVRRPWLMALAWLWVGIPFAYGVYQLILKVIQLFGG
ncbi:hypothetical protein Atai01_37940 [Amycolatopsis taiwanensis]|uniref:Uncharacterized protein n=2 Tax=Amycolatopsis taiwanensis TaxID=342230 RepID=A0A9W6VFV9_9PSEU|nr:hypothetical protein Atai01_37940 [Amycolatopsis taiwanensis]